MAADTDIILDKQHRDLLDSAVRNVLATGLALQTYAEIADGLPLFSSAMDRYGRRRGWLIHPLARHTSLCPGATEVARGFLSEFTIDTLNLSRERLHAYQCARPYSRSFQARLIELVATAVHKLAALLFQRGHCVHDAVRKPKDAGYSIEAVTAWRGDWASRPDLHPDATLFAHVYYREADQYRDGLADVVGYWAENRILGGVVVFDRSASWNDEHRPEPNAYLHSDRYEVTFRICQLLDEQQQALVDFLLSAGPCPLPLTATDENLKRFDPDIAVQHGVYRDIWERKPPSSGPRHCCLSPLDYPKGST